MGVFGISLRYQLAGDEGEAVVENLSVAIERAGANVADWGSYIFPKLTPIFEQAMERQFAAEGAGPRRGHWAPLTAKYAEWKSRNFPGMPILQRSRRLYDALTQSSSPFARRVFSGNTFDFGTRGVPYATFHQLGTVKMVDRAIFDFDPEFERDLQRAAAEGVREAVKDAGAGMEVTE